MPRPLQGLNQLSEADIRRLLADYESRLALSNSAVAADATLRSRPEFLADAAIIRRMCAHCLHALQERLDKLPALLSEAVDFYVTMFRCRNLWEEADRRSKNKPVDISFFSAERMYAAVIDSLILDRVEVLQTVATIDHAVYSNVHPPYIGAYHASIGALTAYGTGDIPTATRRLQRLLQHPEWQTGLTPVVERLRPLLAGVSALCTGDAAALAPAMEGLLSTHRRHAQEGSGARHPATLMCSEGTALAAMARRASVPLPLESPYLSAVLIAGKED